MALSESEILKILDMFDRSSWSDMQLQSGDIKLLISKTGNNPRFAVSAAPAPAAPLAAPASAVVATPTAPALPSTPEAAVDARWIAVRAPMLGTFYAAPKPGAPPFVAIGQQLGAGDTVGILEVMKLMNHLKADAAGRVVRIAVKDGEMVEFDQAILYLEPAA